jgi:hypothetical protein
LSLRKAESEQRPTVSIWKFVNSIPQAERDANPDKPYLWNWDPAIAAALQYLRDNAGSKFVVDVATGATRYDGMPNLHFPKWRYTCFQTNLLQGMHGFRITGDGEGGTLFWHGAGRPLFDIHRSSKWSFEHLSYQNHDGTLASYDPATGSGFHVKGLMENSCFARLRERNDDPNPGIGNTLRGLFFKIEVNEAHRAYRLEGNQQLDDIAWIKCRHRDNFLDFDYRNAQAVNQQLYGGEVVAWVNLHDSPRSFTATAIDDRFTLASHGYRTDLPVILTGASLPGGVTANTTYYVRNVTRDTFQLSTTAGGAAIDLTTDGSGTAQPIDPAWKYTQRTSAWAGPAWHGAASWHPYDGAEYWLLAGGQVGVFGGSRISNKAFVHFDELKTTDDVGLGANPITTLGVHAYNVRWEMRKRDPGPVPMKGRVQQRITMLRYSNISPPDSGGVYRARVDATFDYCKWNVQDGSAATPLRLFHVVNHVAVKVRCVGEAILNPERATVAGFLNNQTPARPGRFEGALPLLAYERLTTSDWTFDNTSGATAMFVDHLVEMEESRSVPLDGSVAVRFRSLALARLASKMEVKSLASSYGVLPGTGGFQTAAVTHQLGGNAKVFRVVAVRTGSGDTTTLAWDVSYTNVFGQAITKRLSLAQSGALPMLAALSLYDFVPNGQLTVTPVTTTATAVQGSLDLEYA